ncbi:MAG: PAS domain-containing protein, partial [Bacteroidota bacterium]
MSRAQILRRRLTSRYIFALSLIALLALAAQGLVQYTLVQHTSDSREVNLAGRQRMLSQTIAKDALAIQRSSEGRQQRLESLRETAATWSQVHVGLLDGDEALGLPGLAPGPERSQLDSLTAVVGRVGRSVERFADAYRDGDSTAADEAMSAILAGEQAFLPAMDRVVFAIDEGSREAIERLRWIELSLMVLTLVVLVIEALFLFRPVVRWASDVLERRPDATVSWMRTRAESSETLVRSLRWMLVLAGGSIITFWFVYQAIGGDRYTDPLIWRIVVAACIVSLAGLSLVSRWVRQRLWSLSVVAGSCIIAYFGWLGAVNGFDVPWTIGTLTVSAATVLATAPYARSVWHVWTAVAAYAGMLALSVIGAGAHTSSALLLVGYTVVLACLAGVASTAYVQTRSALREGRRELEMRSRLLRTVIDAIPDAITVKDREGRCMTRNLADAKLLGFDKVEPTIGLSIFDSELPREHARAFHEEDMQVMKTGEPVRDVASRTGFGTGWKETTRVPLRVDGEVTGLVTVMRDVTEQKEAETALVVAKAAAEAREAEVNAQRQLLQTVIDTIPDQIYVKDRHGRATLRNKASASALGFESPADSLGKTDAEVRADGVGDDAYADDLRVIESGEPLLGKKERTPEGWLLTTKVPLKDEEGEVVSLVGVSRDITAEVAAAVEITAARDAAEAATRAKSEFLANMSHEIRTPMNGVVGMTSLLLDTALDMEQREFVETIRTSGDALLTIINDILDFSKIEAGMLDLEAHPFDIRQCVEEALDLVAQPAAEKGVELAYLIEDGVPA